DSDVIFGLGYDESLGNKIAITLIATGFEQKEPLKKKEEPLAEKKKENEKVVVVLQEEKKKPSQPLFLCDEKNQSLLNKNEVIKEEKADEQKDNIFKTLKEEDVYAAL